MEVLLSLFILGIGMIMVAAVFPVGGNWTRQATEESVGLQIGRNVESLIRATLPNGSLFPRPLVDDAAYWQTGDLFRLRPLQRVLSPGANDPPRLALRQLEKDYGWAAFYRLNPMQRDPEALLSGSEVVLAPSYVYDVYILVFKKREGTYAPRHNEVVFPNENGEWPTSGPPYSHPIAVMAVYSPGRHDPAETPSVFGAVPPMGQFGIGADSGTVFRQSLDPDIYLATAGPGGARAWPYLKSQTSIGGVPAEPVIYMPASTSTAETASPLIYVYQTTIAH
jgi:hypothetical protein